MSESYPHLEDGVIKDFKALMMDRGYWKDSCWNETKHFYLFETGTMLKFISVDKLGKAHGPRRDVLFINEANNIDFNIYDQLEVRTNEVIWLDWNPTNEFWYYTNIHEKIDHDFITLTYLDCLDALPKRIVESIESKKNRKGWWQVYGLGQLGEVEGKIYKDWKIIDNEIPHEAKLVRRGLDFGYTNHPTALIDLYSYNGGFIIDEVAYRKGMKNGPIADVILAQEEQVLVIGDSSEPKSIDEISDRGVMIAGATKGKDSVRHGIQYVQGQKISVTKRSVNVIREYRNYLWETDRDGKILNTPEHEFSHSMDAIRYAIVSLMPKEDQGIDEYEAAAERYINHEEGFTTAALPVAKVKQKENDWDKYQDAVSRYIDS